MKTGEQAYRLAEVLSTLPQARPDIMEATGLSSTQIANAAYALRAIGVRVWSSGIYVETRDDMKLLAAYCNAHAPPPEPEPDDAAQDV